MSDLVPYSSGQIERLSSFDLATSAWKLAEKIAGTDFVPVALRNKPEAVLACMLTGHEAGISPMQALTKIHVVEGRPTMSAELMRALVLRAGHELWYEELSSHKVTACGRRREYPDRTPTRVTWTMDDAKRARVDGKNVWRSYPRAMLTARATSELCRLEFPDVLAGISHTPEELEDGIDVVDGMTLPPAAPPLPTPAGTTRKRAARSVAKPAPAAELDPPPSPPAGELPDLPDGIDPPTKEAPQSPQTIAPSSPSPEEPIAPEIDEESHPQPPVEDDWPSAEWPSGDFPSHAPAASGPRYSGPQILAMKLGERFGIGKGSTPAHRAERLTAIRYLIGRDIESSKDLTSNEVTTLIAMIDGWPDGAPLYEEEAAPAPEAEQPALVDPPAPIAPAPRPAPARTSSPDTWDQDTWRSFLRERKVKVSELMREAARLGAERTPPVVVATLDDLAGHPLAVELVGWVEDLALERDQ